VCPDPALSVVFDVDVVRWASVHCEDVGVTEAELEAEWQAILAEMDAADPWTKLDPSLQDAWRRWIGRTGDTPRIRMYQAANRLNEGELKPPRLTLLRSVLASTDWLSGWGT
jgi:hypothetical protein